MFRSTKAFCPHSVWGKSHRERGKGQGAGRAGWCPELRDAGRRQPPAQALPGPPPTWASEPVGRVCKRGPTSEIKTFTPKPMCWLLGAAIRNHQKLGSSKQRSLSFSFRKPEVQTQGAAGGGRGRIPSGSPFWKPLSVLASARSWACRPAAPVSASLVTGLALRDPRGSDGDPSRWTQGPPEIQDTLISTPLTNCTRKAPFSKEDHVPGLWELRCGHNFGWVGHSSTHCRRRKGQGWAEGFSALVSLKRHRVPALLLLPPRERKDEAV